jgi:hypothetical protein
MLIKMEEDKTSYLKKKVVRRRRHQTSPTGSRIWKKLG